MRSFILLACFMPVPGDSSFGQSNPSKLSPTSPPKCFVLLISISSNLLGALRFLLVSRDVFSTSTSRREGFLPSMKLLRRIIALSTVLSRSIFGPSLSLAFFSSCWRSSLYDLSCACLFFNSISIFFVLCMFVWFTKMAGQCVTGSLMDHISNSTHLVLPGELNRGICTCILYDSVDLSANRTRSTCRQRSATFSGISLSAAIIGSPSGKVADSSQMPQDNTRGNVSSSWTSLNLLW
mmetsp:Transcript_15010/g.38174  ORF Transcript_15010/g.38174 Transcript_15010/m.38174 type:complete len:237 (-) Transcript_15010:1146-1856(-)